MIISLFTLIKSYSQEVTQKSRDHTYSIENTSYQSITKWKHFQLNFGITHFHAFNIFSISFNYLQKNIAAQSTKWTVDFFPSFFSSQEAINYREEDEFRSGQDDSIGLKMFNLNLVSTRWLPLYFSQLYFLFFCNIISSLYRNVCLIN